MSQADRYPAIEIVDAIIEVLKADTYISSKVENFKLNEPIIYKTSMENLSNYDCPAIGVFPPTKLNFSRDNIYKIEPSLYFIDVVEEDFDFVESQRKALKTCYDIKKTLNCNANLNYKVANTEIIQFEELGSFVKQKIFQFAYRIHVQVLSS